MAALATTERFADIERGDAISAAYFQRIKDRRIGLDGVIKEFAFSAVDCGMEVKGLA
jgi:hypothetical protein